MRITIATDHYWPTAIGVATASRNLARGLAAKGHDVLVIAPSQTVKKRKEIDENYRIVRTRSLPVPGLTLRLSVALQNEIRDIIEEHAPDIVHVQTPGPIGLLALRVAKKLDIPAMATNHTMPENLVENVRILQPFARPINHILKEYGILIYKGAEHIIMPTQAAIDMFNYDGLDKNVLVTPISNGIDLSHFKPGVVPEEFLAQYKLPTDRPIISCVCRLDGEKHVHILIKALKRVLDNMDAHLLLVGDGNASNDLKELTHELQLDQHVTFTGRVSDEDLEILQRVGTVFVMPSPAELQCLALLEAMASGQPVVAVKAGALPELCQDGRNGYLCEVDDADAMAVQMLKILQDNQLRAQFSKKSLVIAKTHDLVHTIAQFEAVYRQVIAAHTQVAALI